MNQQPDTSAGSTKGPIQPFLPADAPEAPSDDRLAGEVASILDTINRDPQFVRQIAGLKTTTLVMSATDTGRELLILLDKSGVRARPYAGEPHDVQISATEEVHWAVLSGQMDADAAFFAGRVRISGSVTAAFRIKNKFLNLVQSYLV